MITIAELRETHGKTVVLGSHPAIIQSILDYEYMCGFDHSSVVAIISKGRKQERYFWGEGEIEIPILPDLNQLAEARREELRSVLVVQSGRRVLNATERALELLPNLKCGVIFAERMPEAHALELGVLAVEKGVLLIGPASVGLLIPGSMKLGAIGGTLPPQIVTARIMLGGDTAVVSTSGGMVNELIHAVTKSGLGVSFAIALGGDRFPITSSMDAFLLAEHDAQTKQIIYFGELGGSDEQMLAELIRTGKVTKKVVAYIAGVISDLFETPPQFGHAKAMAQHPEETAEAKKVLLRSVGVEVLNSLSELSTLLNSLSVTQSKKAASHEPRVIGERRKRLIASHISGDINGDVQLLGRDLLQTVEENSLAGLILSMLLGQQVHSKKLIDVTDYVLRLLADHGPYVSGATSTIIAARAGKDLVSSLASGLLTVGPRFGGAINESAGTWLRGVKEGKTPKEFVEAFTSDGGIIAGIGHKKYRVDLPDPRVAALQRISEDTDGIYLRFALEVQAVTTAKKGTLILNVDGAIAAVLLDTIRSELKYTDEQLQELVGIEFFNALFVLSRSIGFTSHYLDQRRNDEGLLRLSDQEISYLP